MTGRELMGGGGGGRIKKKKLAQRISKKNSKRILARQLNLINLHATAEINSKKEFDNERNTCDSKIPHPPPPITPPITFLMVRPLGLFGGASAKRETRNRTQLRHVCHLQLDF